jgi:hypothetical protein
MQINAGLTDKVIARILELSADAHIQRRNTPQNSPAFHKLSGTIAAYGKALALLTALHQREEFYRVLRDIELSEPIAVAW